MGRGSKLLARFARAVEETASRELNRASGVASRQHYGSSSKSLSQKRGFVQPAVAPSTTKIATPVFTDLVGAVSVSSEQTQSLKPNVYYNVDGHRVDDGRFTSFAKDIAHFIPQARVFTDPLRTFAYGTDASFYRLNPKMVIKVHTEAEMQKLLPLAKKHDVPVTFRAAGTSLSGQAITDSVLLKISHTGKNFRSYEIHGDGSQITVEPGLIGGEVNSILAGFHKKEKTPIQYKIGPDPSSIDSCMIGGIVANNSSGMCCGVSQNTYHTLKDLRVVFTDGTVLDTADPDSRTQFKATHADMLQQVSELAQRVQADRELTNLIRRKFSIKCTTGYSINALVDFPATDPIEIIKRLLIGSEGTLGFVSRVTYNTVPEWANKASAFMVFPDVRSACAGASVLRDETTVDAVELFDRASLIQCEGNEEFNSLVDMTGADESAAALLVECRGRTDKDLEDRMKEVTECIRRAGLPMGCTASKPRSVDDYAFTKDASEYKIYWDVRKGLIPIVGAAREAGTSMLIEDVACPVDKLPDMMLDLISMFQRHGYTDASCFGHALEGNLHLVFSQGFRDAEEVQRFTDMFEEMCYIVATKHSGSLKGEHGTGRNVAPFVEMEWGTKAYDLMWDLKRIFDPDNVLNPGVLLNRDPDAHRKFLKPSPVASDIVNRCIECGFCESNCPSKDLSLTPRQRIATYKEISRLKTIPNPSETIKKRLADFQRAFDYDGDATCAADGMCQQKCPVKINTGDLIKSVRAEALDKHPQASGAAMFVADRFSTIAAAVPPFLNTVSVFHRLLGTSFLSNVSNFLNKATGNLMPAWNPYMPKGAAPLQPAPPAPAQSVATLERQIPRKVVYMPSCVTRMMGPAHGDTETDPVHAKLLSILGKAGYEVVYPESISSACCGMIFNSRGFATAASKKMSALEASLLEASEGGKIPIICDTSPCLAQIKTSLSTPALRFALYEPVEFISHFLVDKLEWKQVKEKVAVHVPCSSKKMGIEAAFMNIASRCAENVQPSAVPCCGMAGDRGMRYPELTAASLQHLNTQGCSDGYSTSRTCEMSLSNHSGIHFRGLVYLVDEATSAKKPAAARATA